MKKKTYFNAEERTTVTTLFTMKTWAERIAIDPPWCLDKPCHKRRAAQMLKHIEVLGEAAMADLDEDAANGLKRYVGKQDVKVVPKEDLKRSKDYVVLSVGDFNYIMSRVFADCETCLKTPTEVKQCEIKKILLNCGALPDGTPRGECPFMP